MRIYRYSLTLLSVLSLSWVLRAQGGLSDPAVAPGSPASSYALSGLDHINYYNGLLNTTIPILTIGGRGAASRSIAIPIQRQWLVDNYDEVNSPYTNLAPNVAGLYTSGYISVESAGGNSLSCYDNNSQQWSPVGPYVTYITWTRFDGTKTVLVDTKSDGQEQGANVTDCSSWQSYTQYDRGKVFRATDGSGMMFIADNDVIDQTGGMPSGTLSMRDGTKLRFNSH